MLIGFKLYLITDRKLFADSGEMFAAVEEALKAGVKAVQLREKDLATRELLDMAYRMRELTARYNARLFINDRADIAMCVNADGVHLGQSSMP
ncbi:MAG: thiamine phosphate synthase, partial [Nitrospiraceae bacterium]|nr:thiamine phosphate synthase [Nitrospiraceae bacterium]